jgi:hypothetical protein
MANKIATGSKSVMAYCEETTYGVAPTVSAGDYTGLTFSTESVAQSINTLQSTEVRADRTVPAIRGGNIANAGNISTDFGPFRNGMFLKHLLGANYWTAYTLAAYRPAIMGDEDAYVVGDIACVSDGTTDRHYICVVAGTTTDTLVGITSETIAYVSNDTVPSATTPEWQYIGKTFVPDAVLADTEYNRGDYVSCTVSAVKRVYVVTQGGTTAAAAPELSHETSDPVEIAGATTDVLRFQFILNITAGTQDSDPIRLRQYVMWPSSLPSVGLSFEKIISGHDVAGGLSGNALALVMSGCRVNSVAINIPQEGIVTADWNLIAMVSEDSVTPADAAPTYHSDDPFVGAEGYVEMDFTGERAHVNRPIREATLNIANNSDESVYALGSRHRRGVPEGRRELSGSMTTYFEDKQEYNNFKGELASVLRFSFIHDGNLLLIEMPNMKITGQGTPLVGGAGVVTGTYGFNVYNPTSTDNNDVKITIVGKENAALW